jgi:ferredoxin, 2Fe-2S
VPTIIVISNQEEHAISAITGVSVMESLRTAGIDPLLALCGGCCVCGTCHVHIAAEQLGRLPAMRSEESELLDASSFRSSTSRLSCQIIMSDALDGLRLTVVPEEG